MLWRRDSSDVFAVEYVVGTRDCVAEIQNLTVKVPPGTADKNAYIRSAVANAIQMNEEYVHIYHAIGIKG